MCERCQPALLESTVGSQSNTCSAHALCTCMSHHALGTVPIYKFLGVAVPPPSAWIACKATGWLTPSAGGVPHRAGYMPGCAAPMGPWGVAGCMQQIGAWRNKHLHPLLPKRAPQSRPVRHGPCRHKRGHAVRGLALAPFPLPWHAFTNANACLGHRDPAWHALADTFALYCARVRPGPARARGAEKALHMLPCC